MNSENCKMTEQSVNRSRRAFSKAGLAAPVIMTIASKPVFGQVECASAMVSTTHTSHSPQGECWGGLSPGFWVNPTGATPQGDSTTGAWRLAVGNAVGSPVSDGNAYGTLPRKKSKEYSGNWNSCENYQGGAQYGLTGFGNGGSYTTIREVLYHYRGDEVGRWHWIAGWLNFHYARAKGINYVLNEQDFATAIANGTLGDIASANYE